MNKKTFRKTAEGFLCFFAQFNNQRRIYGFCPALMFYVFRQAYQIKRYGGIK